MNAQWPQNLRYTLKAAWSCHDSKLSGSKSLLEPFSKDIIKRSCSLINIVLENGHDYFFLKSAAVENLTEQFVNFLLNDYLS